VNHVGAQTELVFDGGSLVMNAKGNVVCELAYFEEDFRVFELDWVKTAKSIPFEMSNTFVSEDLYISRIHAALIIGIRDYFGKCI
jgi:NAD+ synthase (glutamine-hydrolysing)